MYNNFMEHFTVAIIGGGASGLFLASKLAETKENVIVFERNDRLGKKLSSTGNGQGNLTNLGVLDTEYFFSCSSEQSKINAILHAHSHEQFIEFLRDMGLLLIADERGRVYPASRQASSVTDALRFFLAEKGTDIRLQAKVVDLEKKGDKFFIKYATPDGEYTVSAEKVVLCAGGKAAKNFGTDGTAYSLAENFGHTVTPLYPSLVQLKTDTTHIKTLKGIRINDGGLTAVFGKEKHAVRGDIIFTDYGVSGDAVFRLSAFVADKLEKGVTLEIDFLPDFNEEELFILLKEKQERFPSLQVRELLCGMVNNQVGRAILKRANDSLLLAASYAKSFPLTVTGSLGFDYAQVTKGGIALNETDENLQSRLISGLYFAGEILDVDGQCGGYNLQWAYASACAVAQSILESK